LLQTHLAFFSSCLSFCTLLVFRSDSIITIIHYIDSSSNLVSDRYVLSEYLRSNADCWLQHLVMQQIFQSLCITFFEEFCCHVSLIVIFAFLFLRFLLFIKYNHDIIAELIHAHLNCRLYNETLHFWTVFAVNFSKTLYFSFIYWWTLYRLQSDRKWKSSLVVSIICCSLIILSTLVALMMKQMYSLIRSFLFSEIEQLIVEAQNESEYW